MLSKFSAILLVCLGALCAVNAHEHDQSATNTSSTDGSTPTANLTDLVAGLKALKFNTLANLLSNHTEKIAKLITTNVTLLAPTDQAFQQASGRLKGLSPDDAWALLEYHALRGNYSTDANSTFFNQTRHTIARTFLNNDSYVDFGPENTKPQVIVLSRNAQGFPVVVQTTANVSFASKDQTYALGNLRLAPITKVLDIPGNLSDTVNDLGLKGLAQAAKAANLTDEWDEAAGATIFAPTDAAFGTAVKAIQGLGNLTLVAGVLNGHVINGTALYSSDLAKSLVAATKDPSKADADGTTTLANLTAGGGQNVTLLHFKNGTYAIKSGNYTASITKTDSLFRGGVIHTIDTVLINTELDPAAAAAAYEQYQKASNSSNPAGGNTTTDGDNGGIANGTVPDNGTITPNSGMPGAGIDISLASCFVALFTLAGGVALLI